MAVREVGLELSPVMLRTFESASERLGVDIAVTAYEPRGLLPTVGEIVVVSAAHGVSGDSDTTPGRWVSLEILENVSQSWWSFPSAQMPGYDDPDVAFCNIRGFYSSRELSVNANHDVPMFRLVPRPDCEYPVVELYMYPALRGAIPHPEFEDAFVSMLQGRIVTLSDDERAAQERERTQQALQEWASTVRSTKLVEQRTKIVLLERDYTEYQRSSEESILKMREEQKLLDALLLVTEDVTDTVLEQWKLLNGDPDDPRRYPGHAKVQSVKFEDGQFTILTTPDLEMLRPSTGDTRWLGQFRLEIPITASSGITLHNLNTRRGGRNHPHIEGNGRPCFGGHQDTIYSLVSQGEIYAAVDIILQYIERLNEDDDWGRHGSYWFDAPDERPVETPALDEVMA